MTDAISPVIPAATTSRPSDELTLAPAGKLKLKTGIPEPLDKFNFDLELGGKFALTRTDVTKTDAKKPVPSSALSVSTLLIVNTNFHKHLVTLTPEVKANMAFGKFPIRPGARAGAAIAEWNWADASAQAKFAPYVGLDVYARLSPDLELELNGKTDLLKNSQSAAIGLNETRFGVMGVKVSAKFAEGEPPAPGFELSFKEPKSKTPKRSVYKN